MFTGIITDIGEIAQIEKIAGGLRLRIAAHYDAESINLGASIACAGICLTVTDRGRQTDGGRGSWFSVEAWEEALRLTTISSWREGGLINLERSLRAGDELGGHIVSGHVDGTAEIIAEEAEGEAHRFQIKAPAALSRFIAPKGSVCLDGVSLTVNKAAGDVFDILLIRHSLKVTTWGERKTGDKVNIEIDPLARYIARLAQASQGL